MKALKTRHFKWFVVVVVQSLSHVQLFEIPWTAACQASLSFTSPGVCSNSYPLSWWCHTTISSYVAPFSSCPQSFQASGSFPVSWLFASDGQSTGASASASVLPMNIQGWFPLGLTGFNDTKWKFWTLDSKFCYCCSCGSCICIVTFLN